MEPLIIDTTDHRHNTYRLILLLCWCVKSCYPAIYPYFNKQNTRNRYNRLMGGVTLHYVPNYYSNHVFQDISKNILAKQIKILQ